MSQAPSQVPSQTPLPNALDDPRQWQDGVIPPPADVRVEDVQREIDSLVGTTRDGKSIAKLVWNGDVSYWKDVCLDWDSTGAPVRFIKRPYVLYRSVWDAQGHLVKDIPVPRWLILTRIEPEQYVPGWKTATRVYHPDRRLWVQVKRDEPPKEWHVWFMTISEHNGHCCRVAAKALAACYGARYAHPRACLPELKRAVESTKHLNNQPFDAPDLVTANLRHNTVNNYQEQALKRYSAQASRFLDAVPGRALKDFVSESTKRGLDRIEQEQKRLIITG